jgi:hypothetical protein
MSIVPSHPSRWTQSMLRKVERFRRVAAWPQTPGMRFHLSRSPLRLLRERLWLLSRLQPLTAVHWNVSNPVRLIAGETVRMSTRIIQRSSVLLTRMELRETWIPGSPAERAASDIPRFTNRADVVFPRTTVPLSTARQEGKVRQDRTPVASSAAQVAARLARREARHDDLPNAPSRLVRKSALSAPSAAPRPEQGGSHLRRTEGFEPTSATPPWPSRAEAPPINVEQLTDQVLKNLDRRLIASRERLGRI